MARAKKRADGRYCSQIYLGRDENGKRKYKSVYAKTPAELKEKETSVRLQLGQGLDVLSQRDSFATWADDWLRLKEKEQITCRQMDNYRRAVKLWKEELPGYEIGQVRADDVERVLIALSDQGLAQRTVDLYRSAMRQIMRRAVGRVIPTNPVEQVELAAVGRKAEQRRALTAEERQWIWNTPHRAQPVAVIMMLSGLRRGELAALSDFQVGKRLPSIRVVARALPTDKSRLVRIAQEMELVAGMTGDGINDAPALKKADVGFAMGSGTEVAKEAGDIVILDDNIASIARAVLYGRTIFKSIRKFIVFQLTMNLCAVGVSIIGPFIGIDTPVTVIQMLWINIIMDTLAGLAFAGEPPLEEYMAEPPKKRDEPVLNRYMLHQILCMGIFTVGLCVAFLKLPVVKTWFRYANDPIYLMTAFFALFIFTGIFNSLNARTHRVNLFAHLFQNLSFVGIMAAVAIIQLLLIYFGGTVFRTAGLELWELRRVMAMALLVIPADMARKLVMRLFGRKGSL